MKTLDFKLSRARENRETGEHEEKLLCFHKGNSSTQSNPSSTTNTDITDQRVAASEGSVSAGSGASISIQNSDADAIGRIAESANDSSERTATAAITGNVDAVKVVTSANKDVSVSAIETVRLGQRDALDFGSDLAALAIKGAIESQRSANDLVKDTNENFVAKLAANAGEAPTTLADNTVKYITIASAVIGLVLLFKPNNTK